MSGAKSDIDVLAMFFPPSKEAARKLRSDHINSQLRAATARTAPSGSSDTIPARAVPHLPKAQDDASKKSKSSEKSSERKGPSLFLDTPAVENIRSRMEEYARRQAEKRAQRGRS